MMSRRYTLCVAVFQPFPSGNDEGRAHAPFCCKKLHNEDKEEEDKKMNKTVLYYRKVA